MPLILEGCDGVGKTTLAEQVADLQDDVKVLHFGQPEKHPLAEYGLPIQELLPQQDPTLVIDRFHLGEQVYGELYRSDNLGDAGRLWIDMLLHSKGSVVAVVEVSEEEARRRLLVRGEDFLEMRHIRHVLTKFRRLAKQARAVPTLVVDQRCPTIPETLAALTSAAESAADWPIIQGKYSFIGSPNPKYVLVGDKPADGPSAKSDGLTPPFPPYAGTSGKYLMETLLESDLPLTQVAILNSEDVDVRQFVTQVGAQEVVALGRNASQRLNAQNLRHGVVPHPQYVRRFHHRARGEYAKKIKTALREQRDLGSW